MKVLGNNIGGSVTENYLFTFKKFKYKILKMFIQASKTFFWDSNMGFPRFLLPKP